jgi:hypothetical protein
MKFGEMVVQLHQFLPRHKMEASGQFHAPATLLSQGDPRYRLDRICGPQL